MSDSVYDQIAEDEKIRLAADLAFAKQTGSPVPPVGV